jgi:hypothetical protein
MSLPKISRDFFHPRNKPVLQRAMPVATIGKPSYDEDISRPLQEEQRG